MGTPTHRASWTATKGRACGHQWRSLYLLALSEDAWCAGARHTWRRVRVLGGAATWAGVFFTVSIGGMIQCGWSRARASWWARGRAFALKVAGAA
ncbi:MAG: hypothetical protein HYV19_04280 [Gemmatimonadetes bacterium]|nr:hypothetical protein [Gemmatimonadota bacterium]